MGQDYWRSFFTDIIAHRHKMSKENNICDTNTVISVIIKIAIDT